jgi:tetratricopeptide (TPR) repeat protein
MADRLEANAGLLGYHFYLAGDERALKYYTLAGEVAYRLYANTEAVAHYTRALEIARRAGRADRAALQKLYARRGRALELNAHYREALDNYAEMESAAREIGDRPLELSALLLRATIYATPNPSATTIAPTTLRAGTALARELDDRAAEARILWNLQWLNALSGRSRQAQAYGEQSLAIARELNLREQLAFTLNDIFEIYVINGDIDKAQAAQIEARDLWRELGNLPMLADNLARSGQLYLVSGDMAALIAASDEAYAISQSIGNQWGVANSRMLAGLAYWDLGEYGTAIAIMEESARLAEQVGHAIAFIFIRLVLAHVYAALGAIAHGLEVAETLLTYTRVKQPLWTSLAQGALARLYLLNGDLPAAEAIWHAAGRTLAPGVWLPQNLHTLLFPLTQTEAEIALARSDYVRALTLANEISASIRRVGYRSFIPDVLYLKGRVLLAQDQIDSARPVLEEARAEAEAIGSRRSLWPILIALSEVEARSGDPARAEDLRRRAQEIVEYIADHIADPAHPINGPLTLERLRPRFSTCLKSGRREGLIGPRGYASVKLCRREIAAAQKWQTRQAYDQLPRQ